MFDKLLEGVCSKVRKWNRQNQKLSFTFNSLNFKKAFPKLYEFPVPSSCRGEIPATLHESWIVKEKAKNELSTSIVFIYKYLKVFPLPLRKAVIFHKSSGNKFPSSQYYFALIPLQNGTFFVQLYQCLNWTDLGPVQTPNFSWAKLYSNSRRPKLFRPAELIQIQHQDQKAKNAHFGQTACKIRYNNL